MITAGSVRGKCSEPSAGQRRTQPPFDDSVGVPSQRAAWMPVVPARERDGGGEQPRVPVVQSRADLAQVRPPVRRRRSRGARTANTGSDPTNPRK